MDDWRAVHTWASQQQSCRYQAWGPNTEAQTRAFVADAVNAWEQRPQLRYVYAITCDDQVVGMGELKLRQNSQAEIGYAVHPDHWGRGHASLAARQLLHQAFERHGVHRVFATCDPRNTRSAAVLRRLGMTHEGRLREVLHIRDGWRDSDVYGLLAHEWASSEVDSAIRAGRDGQHQSSPPSPASLVREFHRHVGVAVRSMPTVEVDGARRRCDFVEEEARELRTAVESIDVVATADALADLAYVVYGAALHFGVDLDAVLAEVHRSNMTKSPAGDGKAIKGPGYEPPAIEQLFRTGARSS